MKVPVDKDKWRETYNPKNIHNLTFKEIVTLNREKNKDTFMDRSWRDRVDKEGSVLDDPSFTRWQKFKAGGYSLNNLGKSFATKLAIK